MLLAGFTAAAPSPALETLSLHIGQLEAATWSSGNVDLAIDLGEPGGVAARLRADGLALPAPFDTLRRLTLDCPHAAVRAAAVQCPRAVLGVWDDQGQAPALPMALDMDQSDERWRLRGTATLAAATLWSLAVRQSLVPALQMGGGTLSLDVQLTSDAGGPALGLDAAVSELAFSDSAGLHAGEGVSARGSWRLSRGGDAWRVSADLELDAGQLFLDPLFLDAGATPVRLSAGGDLDAGGGLRLSTLSARQQDTAEIQGMLAVDAGGALQSLDVRLKRASLDRLYQAYLRPFAVGSLFDRLDTEGELDAHLQWNAPSGPRRVRVNFHDAGFHDRHGRFALSGLAGRLEWTPDGGAASTRLGWDGGRLYRIDLGTGVLAGRLMGRRFTLDAPLSLPMLEGAVQIDTLEIADMGTPGLNWRFRGDLQPMSLQALTRALAWPSFGGSMAGNIPLVSFANGTLSVDGSLDLKVFEGTVRVRNLSVADPFGVIPVLRAKVDLHDLSLDALTSTFSFGKIQGRLQGHVHGLILKDWNPTTFDARFATPEDDDSRHRISQRAVENLASLGGAGGVLSSTFLRIFDEFSYRRLGISCRLSGGVCEMDGVAPAEQGYYIVEGGGLPPRIDVLGFNRRVDWPVLLGRLKQINSAEGAVIR